MSPARRRGRGIDFDLRFRTSRWAEDLLLAECGRHEFFAVRLGLSETSEDGTPRDTDTRYKLPDLLLFEPSDLEQDEMDLLQRTDLTQLSPSDLSPDTEIGRILCKALCAIEVEFSPYRASEMAGRAWQPKTPAQLARRQYLHANPPTAPNIWVKHEDMGRLIAWQDLTGVPILVAHLFDQEAFAIPLNVVREFFAAYSAPGANKINLQLSTGIFSKTQAYDRSDAQGAGEQKDVFVITPAAATRVGRVANVVVGTQLLTSTSKKYVAHVLFKNGTIDFDTEFIALVRSLGERAR